MAINTDIQDARQALLELKGKLFNLRMTVNQDSATEYLIEEIDKTMDSLNQAETKLTQLAPFENALPIGHVKVGMKKYLFSRVLQKDGVSYGYMNQQPCCWWGEVDEDGCPLPFSGGFEADIDLLQERIAENHELFLQPPDDAIDGEDTPLVWVLATRQEVRP